MTDQHRFDLVDQPWIPVVRQGGSALASLRECLLSAADIEGLAVESALETVAVLRQALLPVHLTAVYRDADTTPVSPDTWGRWWTADPTGQLCAGYHDRVEAYLDEHRGEWQLFGDRPFAQVAGLHTAKNETKPVSILIAAAASGNNVPLFSAHTEANPPALRPDEAARALLATHCWDTASIKTGMVGDSQVKAGKTTGNPTGPLGSVGLVIPVGRTLWETLLLNTRILRQGLRPGDRPQWHVPGTAEWSSRHPLGLLDLLTWQSRRIRLIPQTSPDGATVVRQVLVGAGDRLTTIPIDVEPHTAWKLAGPKGRQEQRPVRHVPGRAAWRGLAALLATAPATPDGFTSPILLGQIGDLQVDGLIPQDYPLQVLTVGVEYGTQSAVVEDTMVDSIPLPVVALDPSADNDVRRLLDQVVAQAEALRQAANNLENNLRQAMAGDKIPWDKGQHLGEVLIHACTPVARRMLAGLQRQPHRAREAADAWRETARRLALAVAEPVLDIAARRTFVGRRVNDKVAHRAATAEMWYRAEIAKALGRHEPVTTGGL